MFYYTPQFAANTDNIEDFLDLVIEETNQGILSSTLRELAPVVCMHNTVHMQFTQVKSTLKTVILLDTLYFNQFQF